MLKVHCPGHYPRGLDAPFAPLVRPAGRNCYHLLPFRLRKKFSRLPSLPPDDGLPAAANDDGVHVDSGGCLTEDDAADECNDG